MTLRRQRRLGWLLILMAFVAAALAVWLAWGLMVAVALVCFIAGFALITDSPARPRRGELRRRW